MNSSFLRLSRSYFTHYFWDEPRKYSRAEAWLDLVRTAAYQPTTRLVKGVPVRLQRGSLIASIRYLSSRWAWSNTKICQYLQILQAEGMITAEKRHNTTVITLCNYDTYNPPSDEESDEEKPKKRHRSSSKNAGRSVASLVGAVDPNGPPLSAPLTPSITPSPAEPPPQNSSPLSEKSRANSVDEVVAYCLTLGLRPSDGEYLWETWQAGGWSRGGHPIKDWQASVRSWKAGHYLPSQKQTARRAAPKTGPVTALHDPTGAIAAQY